MVVQALLFAAGQRKRFQVYVTESRPVSSLELGGCVGAELASPRQFGLGLKTHAVLLENNIESVVVLDSAVSFIMGKVDMCIVGAEAVCESGGLVNYVSSPSAL